MRVGIAQMSHETNTFSPVITDLARFSGGRDTPLAGEAALSVYRGTGCCLGGYIGVAEARGHDIFYYEPNALAMEDGVLTAGGHSLNVHVNGHRRTIASEGHRSGDVGEQLIEKL